MHLVNRFLFVILYCVLLLLLAVCAYKQCDMHASGSSLLARVFVYLCCLLPLFMVVFAYLCFGAFGLRLHTLAKYNFRYTC